MKKYRLNKKKFARFIAIVIGAVVLPIAMIIFIRFPELYSTTWKNQLRQDIESGNAEMIEYYERNYVANGIELFD